MKPILHPKTLLQIDAVVAYPNGSFLLHGPSKAGKYLAALEVARQLNCTGCDQKDSCRSCTMIKSGNHPDVAIVEPDDKHKIGIDQIHTIRHDLTYSRYEPLGRRIVIIKNADKMTFPAQNALLKSLEEPPNDTTFILTALSPVSLLETVVSRCKLVYFSPSGQSNGEIDEKDQNEADESAVLADKLTSKTDLFVKLKIAADASKDSMTLHHLIDDIEKAARWQAREKAEMGSNVIAVEKLRRRLAANVSPRAALEAFAVESVC